MKNKNLSSESLSIISIIFSLISFIPNLLIGLLFLTVALIFGIFSLIHVKKEGGSYKLAVVSVLLPIMVFGVMKYMAEVRSAKTMEIIYNNSSQ